MRPFHAARVVIALLTALIIAYGYEFWLRLRFLPWYDRGDPEWPRMWNRYIRGWGTSTFAATRFLLGLKIEVEGSLPTTGRYLIVSNHQSSLDIIAFIWLFRGLNLKFVAHDGLARGKPAVSLALRKGGFAVIAKTDREEDMEALSRFAEDLEWFDSSAVIFPEGRRTLDGNLLRFRFGGTETVSRTSRLPVLPVVFDGLWQARSIGSLMNLIGGTVRFRILDLVPFEEIDRSPWKAFEGVEASIRTNLDAMRRGTDGPN
jgi:1-acyl-sn-glycerol-3-phosphate acyltransferase